MRKHTSPRWHWLVGPILTLFLLAGCYQAAGTGSSQATPISQSLPTATPPPTDTPPPPTDTPEPPTPDASTLGQGGSDLLTQPPLIAQAATLDPLDPFGATATTTYLLNTEPLFVTATFVVLQATRTVEAQMTQTAGPFFPATATPLPTQPGAIATSVPLVPGATCIHEVRAEDLNLYRISLRYGTTVQDIAQASGVTNINLITIGQRLTVPGCGTLGVTPPPTSTAAAGVATPLPGTTPVPSGGGRVHVVQQGQTLFELSLLYGVPVASIASANGIANINLIYLGQELVIP